MTSYMNENSTNYHQREFHRGCLIDNLIENFLADIIEELLKNYLFLLNKHLVF